MFFNKSSICFISVLFMCLSCTELFQSGARINISDGSSPERIVTITGTTEQIYVAFTLMSRKFEDVSKMYLIIFDLIRDLY